MPAVAAPAAPAYVSDVVVAARAADNSFSSVLNVTLNGRTAAEVEKKILILKAYGHGVIFQDRIALIDVISRKLKFREIFFFFCDVEV